MKTIVFISSIFYILGLKLGYRTDAIKTVHQVTKLTKTAKTVNTAAKSIYFNDEAKKTMATDSLKTEKPNRSKANRVKHF